MTMQMEEERAAHPHDASVKTFRMGELFSGPGGLGVGAHLASNQHGKIVHRL